MYIYIHMCTYIHTHTYYQVPDLGLDRVVVYGLDAAGGKLQLVKES